MLTLVAALTISLNLGEVLRDAQPVSPAATCGIRTVSYRFVGEPGREFRYGGDVYRIPRNGSIELIAGRRTRTYQVGDRSIPLDLTPPDAFGSRLVELPAAE